MVSVLLSAGAEPRNRGNGPNQKDAITLAESIQEEPESKYRAEAAIILEMLNDDSKVKERFSQVLQNIQVQNERELAIIKKCCLICLPLLLLLFFWNTR